MSSLQELADSSYALVTTFRKDGRAVATPVWIVKFEDGLAFWTVKDTGKVKRIRRAGKVTVATCDLRGNNAGPAAPGTAEILDYPGTERVRAALRRKYGLIGRITLAGSRLRRGKYGTVGIKVVLTPQ
ncbi:PPOX class F420-dependent oxidoreductase [Rhizocola hellebori]|uniref:PPOX class F420-dependent oxidoreductase n=1 Tax=Rhizocola hellebori TaxID=1392758 RepID=A0A8J3QHX5_9ACTN|nr:PPOX class F420-dependent oxidoreductase [Rhizocola hellebori]GIH10352.1 PPOX class F420-dependent oxidoreductase [Rhizocola hellebori]